MPVGPAVPAAVPSKSQHAAHGRQLSQHAAHATHDGRSRTQQHSQLHEMIPQHAEWKAYYHHLCGLSIAGQPLCGLLTHLIQWKFSLTPTQLRRAAAHVGPNHRLRRVVRDLITGHAQVNIGVIGTSVSFGTGATDRGRTDWFSVLGAALRESFPKANFTMHNGCFPGTPSSFANMCHSKMVRPDVDLLLIEYVTNDFAIDNSFHNVRMMAYERLLRKVLQKPALPAVLLVQHLTWGQGFPVNFTLQGQPIQKKMYHESSEDQYGSIAQYYSIPWLSYRNAVYIDAAYKRPWFPDGWKALSDDYVHPNDAGHRAIADIVMWLVLNTAVELLIQPFSRIDSDYIHMPLPPPMQDGNYEEPTETCLLDVDLQQIVVEADSVGWGFVNEGTAEKPKTGFVSTTPGTKLVLELNASAVLGSDVTISGPEPSDVPDRSMSLMISYLRSYSGYGIVALSCGPGCTCNPSRMDAHSEQRTSVTYMKMLTVVASNHTCRVTLSIQPETRSGGHKFKVTAVMMSRSQDISFNWPEEPAMFVAADVFSGAFGKEGYLEEEERGR